jgi:histidinol-phosphate aminotransferase
LGERTGEFAAACEEAGIMVRPFGQEGVRVTIGEPEANDVLIATASAFARG